MDTKNKVINITNLQPTYTDYLKIHDLVLDYKSGNKTNQVELINAFGAFIYAYVKLIKDGEFDIANYSVRQFIKFFIPNPNIKKAINCYQFKPNIHYEIDKTIRLITGIFSEYNALEVQDDLTIVFLKFCRTYKDTKPTFHIYMQKFFHFYVLQYYKPLIQNASINNKQNHIPIEDMEDILEDEEIEKVFDKIIDNSDKYHALKKVTGIKLKDTASVYSFDHFNTNWIMGNTCSEIFKGLTTLERDIVIQYYIYGRGDAEVAEQYGVCRATINRRKRDARLYLKDLLF